ncbi:MAG: hypothetical protein KDK26_10575 [Roseivivax sp.]|nr:hypothetical protein [Roseivivax sp.]
MAFFDDFYSSRPLSDALRGMTGAARSVLDTPFDQRARQISTRIAQLRAMDDAVLSDLGVPREKIVPYVLGVWVPR